jgi:hypothetical protein
MDPFFHDDGTCSDDYDDRARVGSSSGFDDCNILVAKDDRLAIATGARRERS